jgi:hypothetical protein
MDHYKTKYRIREQRTMDHRTGDSRLLFTVQAEVSEEDHYGDGIPYSNIYEAWHNVSGDFPMRVHAVQWIENNEVLSTEYHYLSNNNV